MNRTCRANEGACGRTPAAINPLAYTEKVIRSFLRYQLVKVPGSGVHGSGVEENAHVFWDYMIDGD